MMNIVRTLSFVLAASVLTACSSSSSTPTSPSGGGGNLASVTSDQLSGTWTLMSIQAAGQASRPSPAGATYTLTFTDGRLSTRADCNVCGGSFTLSGQTLS